MNSHRVYFRADKLWQKSTIKRTYLRKSKLIGFRFGINPASKEDEALMERVCKRNSPLCNDRDLFMNGKEIFESKWVPRELALGIMNAESSLGKYYAWTCDASWNNRGGVKRRKEDDWTSVKDQPIPNDWCWLYRFDSLEDYFNSKANTLGLWYKACMSRGSLEAIADCVSYSYVGERWVHNPNRVKNVLYF